MARKKNKNKATKPKVGEKETDVRPSGEEKKEEDANNNQVQTLKDFHHDENEKIGQGAVPKENEVVVSVEKTCSSKGSRVEEKNFEKEKKSFHDGQEGEKEKSKEVNEGEIFEVEEVEETGNHKTTEIVGKDGEKTIEAEITGAKGNEKEEESSKIENTVESEKSKAESDKTGNSKKEKKKGCESETGCTLCGRDIGGPTSCKKCKTLLCHSCLPLHIFRARCLPWKVEKGRLVATRDIKPLEVVIVDRAVVTVPMGGKVACLGCARDVNLSYVCPSCSLPLCGTECPRAPNHRTECSILSKHPPLSLPTSEEDVDHPLFAAVGIIRILDMKRERPLDWARISKLPCKIESLKSSKSINSSLEKVQQLLQPIGYEMEEVEHAFCLIRLNGYNLHDLPDGKVRSLFPLQSRLSHSCLPSLQYIEREGGRHIVLQAVKSISKGEGLTVRYTPFLQGRIGLTRWLREERFTTCTCARCVDGTELGTFTSSALCPKSECRERGGLLLPVDPQTLATDWICSSCQELTKSTDVEALEESFVKRFSHMPKGDLNSYYRFLNELGERFHASHHLVMRMAQFLVTLQGKCLESLPIERIETQSLLCEKLIAYVSRLDPGATQNRAKTLLEKNKADLNLAKLECEAGKITRKVFMQKIKEGVKVEINAKKILYFKWDDEPQQN